MDIRRFGATTVALTALSSAAFAQTAAAPPAPATTTQTQTTEQVKQEQSTTVTTNDGQGAKTETNRSEYSRNSSTGTAPAKPAAQEPARPQATAAVIPWSHADTRPSLQNGDQPGLYIWHEKNTVYVAAVGGASGVHVYEGSIDIENGRFDTLKNVSADGQDKFSRDANNRVTFRLNTGRKNDMFKFNLREGANTSPATLKIYATLDGQPTDRLFFGGPMTQVLANPATFDLRR
jgi:hypothetical protein